MASNNGFNVIYNNSYHSNTDYVAVNSTITGKYQYNDSIGSNNYNATTLFNSFLGNSGNTGYIFGANTGILERTNFIILMGLEDKDLNSKKIFIGISSDNDITASTADTVWGMTP